MEPQRQETRGASEKVRRYFREVSERHKLPPLPVVVATALKMIRDPDVEIAALCRVLSDDAALTARVLSLSRSPIYGRRHLPVSLHEAITVLGLRALRRALLAAATHTLCRANTQVSKALWNHSLAAALAAQTLARAVKSGEADRAFLVGLLHDVGEMVLLHGDPGGSEKLWRRAQEEKLPMIECEKAAYGFDHTLIGLTLIDCWNLEHEIGEALLTHHNHDDDGAQPDSLDALLRMADYLAHAAGLGFFTEPPFPPEPVLRFFGCDTPEGLARLVEEVREAFEAENSLFA